jgi:hypothetical protein
MCSIGQQSHGSRAARLAALSKHALEVSAETDEDNLILLCVRHHHAVHEGAWAITRAAGIPPGGTGFWEFAPPPRRRRP